MRNSLSGCKIFLLFLLAACHTADDNANKKNTAAAESVPAAVEVFGVQKGRLSSSLQVPGELISFQQVDLYAKENSFVKKLYVDVGSEVKEGQLLVSLEAPELGSQLAGALSEIKVREATYLASKANYNRLVATSKTPGTISPNDLEQAAARKDADYAQLQAAQAAHRQIAETQNYLQIRAPFSGVITSRNVNTGAYVGPSGKGSDMPLFTLQEQKKLRLVVSVPESHSSYLAKDNEVSFTVRALPDEHFKAAVKRLAGAIDNRLHAQRIEMDVTNTDKKLLPGMVAEVNVPLPAKDSTFIVPKTAVVNSTENIFVIRVINNKAEWVNVKTGREAKDNIEIYGTLQPGDQLIKIASDEIRNGSTLKNIIKSVPL
ncbi:MAG TPA: efflux RND transporter periplasmic adaptor subunit [Flavitalea sp.]|nr:efflux RND transporter periplasmic adaptor subunit [Flavitalea sp.]